MNEQKFKQDLMGVLYKHKKDIAAFVFAVTYESEKGIVCVGNAVVPVPPRDHEEEALRDKCVKDVVGLVTNLTKNVYLGR